MTSAPHPPSAGAREVRPEVPAGGPAGRMWVDGSSRWLLPAVPPEPASVTLVRQQTRAVLAQWGIDDLRWAAELLITELTTNVVRHARTMFNVGMTWDRSVLRCEVTDADPRPPSPSRLHPDDAVGGRGLLLVAEIALRWGVQTFPQGKTVWFELKGSP